MSTTWSMYGLLIFSGLSVLVPFGFLGAMRVVLRSKSESSSHSESSSGVATSGPIPPTTETAANSRFYLPALLGFGVFLLAALLIPVVAGLHEIQQATERFSVFKWLIAVLTLGLLLMLALFYASRKGDFDWLRSYDDRTR